MTYPTSTTRGYGDGPEGNEVTDVRTPIWLGEEKMHYSARKAGAIRLLSQGGLRGTAFRVPLRLPIKFSPLNTKHYVR